MSDKFDCYNAPQYIDFQSLSDDTDVGDVDKFFDVPFELHPGPETASSSTASPLKLKEPEMINNSSDHLEEENKENTTKQMATPAKKRRSKSAPPLSELNQSNVGDISAYQTPGTSKRKSQVTFMNGRSLLVQNYDGISIVTPNKTHPMETRLDIVIKSPGLALRSRSVQRLDNNDNNEKEANKSAVRKSRRFIYEEMQKTEVVAEESSPTTSPVKEVEKTEPPAQPAVPLAKPIRIRHQAPMMAKHPALGTRKRANEDALPNKGVKFMAAAEVVHHFHRDTPDRFHTRPVRENKMHIRKPSATQMLQRKNTIPKSPFLKTKSRQLQKFQPHIATQKEKEEALLEEMKQHQVKANPLDPKVLIPPVHKAMIAVKTPTRCEPFKLSQGKRKMPTPEPVFKFKAQPIPRGMLASPKGIPPKQGLPLTEPQSPAFTLNSKYPKRVKVETPGNIEKEVGHFGIQNTKRDTPTRNTTVKPFSFEERDRQMLERKHELIKKHLDEERKTHEFKAQKKPHFASAPHLPEKKRMPVTVPHTPQLSAFTLGAHQQQKFKEKIAAEEEELLQQAQFKARPAKVTQKQPFVPVLPKRTLQDITELQLNTEKRAAERAKFDELLKLKEEDNAKAKAELEAQREREQQEEEARLRKEAEFRANPALIKSPPRIEPSSKPLTEPITPHLQVQARANRSRVQ